MNLLPLKPFIKKSITKLHPSRDIHYTKVLNSIKYTYTNANTSHASLHSTDDIIHSGFNNISPTSQTTRDPLPLVPFMTAMMSTMN